MVVVATIIHIEIKAANQEILPTMFINVGGRFAQNIEYLFCAQYIADIKQIESDATLAILLS